MMTPSRIAISAIETDGELFIAMDDCIIDLLPFELLEFICAQDYRVYHGLALALPRFGRQCTKLISRYMSEDKLGRTYIWANSRWYKHSFNDQPHVGQYANKWYCRGLKHRLSGPAHVTHKHDDVYYQFMETLREWYHYGVLHRIDGPAVEYADGTIIWYVDGKKIDTVKWDIDFCNK